jgi:hypothetical protein
MLSIFRFKGNGAVFVIECRLPWQIRIDESRVLLGIVSTMLALGLTSDGEELQFASN